VAIEANLAEDRAFVDLLRDVGHDPTVTSEVRPPALLRPELCGLLGWSAPRDVCTVARVHRASGRPAVFLLDHVPVDLLTTPRTRSPVRTPPSSCSAPTPAAGALLVAEVRPVLADAEVAGRLQVEVGHPLLLLLHTHLDEDDEALAVTEAYVDDRYLKFSVVRTYRDA
jgi:DNA-binding GntR family transcriptional regulator